MKIKIILGLIAFTNIICNNLYCQDNNLDYYNYYLNVYKAEEKICEEQLDSALFFYKKVFQNYDRKFYYDLHNAILCAESTKQYHQLNSFLKDFYQLGYVADFLNKNTFSVLNSIYGDNYIDTLNMLLIKFQENIDTNLIIQCKKRNEEDQRTNHNRMNNGTVESKKLFHQTIYDNIEWLVKIIDSCGYPDRKMLGYNRTPEDAPIGLMIIHYFQKKGNKTFPLLKKIDFYKYPEDSIINETDRIPLLKILADEVKNGNMWLGEYIKFHNWIRSIENGKYFYNEYYNSEKWPPVFSEEQDSVLMELSKDLFTKIEALKTADSVFIPGESLYKLANTEELIQGFQDTSNEKK